MMTNHIHHEVEAHKLDEMMREIGWHFSFMDSKRVLPDCVGGNLTDFLIKRKQTRKVSFPLYKYNASGVKISHITIYALDDGKNYQFEISSHSEEQEIYKNFKTFMQTVGWETYLDGDRWGIYYRSPLYLRNEVEKIINQIFAYDALPFLIKCQLRIACDLIPITSAEISEELINKGFQAAFQFIATLKPISMAFYESAVVLLADACFKIGDIEHACEAYHLISTNNLDLYKKAQYQLGILYFTQTDPAFYDNERDHAKVCLPYFMNADDYLDSAELSRKLFACLCQGSYSLTNKDMEIVRPKDINQLLKCADSIYAYVKSLQDQIGSLTFENKLLATQQHNFKERAQAETQLPSLTKVGMYKVVQQPNEPILESNGSKFSL